MTAPVPPCPICASPHSGVEDVLTPAQICDGWRQLGVELSPTAQESFGGVQEIRRFRCGNCGLAHFDPVLPGNGAFYSDLQRQLPDYYQPTRPAFDRALKWATDQGYRGVLDVGCGSGAFLDQAARRGLQTAGLDLNPDGVAECRKRGHDVHQRTAAAFFEECPDRRFDLVTSFEVMEHVPGPAGFFASAASLVRPGGGLVVSVPNDGGLPGLARLIPHQWPPHHLTLWRRRNLQDLAEQNGLEVVALETDPLPWAMVRLFLEVQQQQAHRIGRRKALNPWVPRLGAWAYRLSGARYWWSGTGTSITLICQRT